MPFSIALLRKGVVGLMRLLPLSFYFSLISYALYSLHLKYFRFLVRNFLLLLDLVYDTVTLSYTLSSHSLFGLTLPYPLRHN